jgi:LysR family carnitine catabolism transcriptional activator
MRARHCTGMRRGAEIGAILLRACRKSAPAHNQNTAMRIKLRQVEGFLAAADAGSFSRAAEKIGMTQPAFSQLIREMESVLDVKLFDRSTRQVHITETGKLLREQMRRGLLEIEEACSNARAIIRLERGMLSLAVLPSLAFGFVTAALAKYRQAYPGISVRLFEAHNGVAIDRVVQRQADFAVCTDLHVPPSMSFETLFEDELVAVLPSGHRLARRKTIEWPRLVDEMLILISAQSSANNDLVKQAFEQNGLDKTPDCEVLNIVTALSMVRAGFGVTIVPRVALPELNMRGLAYRRMMGPSLTRNIGLCSRRDRTLLPAAERFREVLLAERDERLADAARAKAHS